MLPGPKSAAEAVAAGLLAWWRARLAAAIETGADTDAIEAALHLPVERAPWTVYAVRFVCGAAYVGLTGRLAYARLLDLFGGAGTRGIQAEVDAGCADRCVVLGSGLSEADARARERRAIAALEKPLNVGGRLYTPCGTGGIPSAVALRILLGP